jgi:hypothetical protein
MKNASRRTRPCLNLPEPVQQRLNAYALAASAAGVGMLTMTQQAGAKIVYTPTHKYITRTHAVALDLNNDGKRDFNFHETFLTTSSVGEDHSLILSVLPAHRGNEIVGKAHHASALAARVQVGSKDRFFLGKKTMAVDYYADGTGGSGTCAGNWNNVKNRYLGLKFSINGQTHYGWARLNVSCITMYDNHQVSGVLTGYAYETVPNRPIITGKTKAPDESTGTQSRLQPPSPAAPGKHATLGALAMGSQGLSIWKREDSVPHSN